MAGRAHGGGLGSAPSVTTELAPDVAEGAEAREAQTEPPEERPEDGAASGVEIPDRRYFRIGEVATLLGVRPHVLRYWETEFRELHPPKSRRGQRLYRRRDVELLVAIRRLLHEERYTIAGARERLKEILAARQLQLFVAPKPSAAMLDTRRLEHLRDGLVALLALIDRREREQGGGIEARD